MDVEMNDVIKMNISGRRFEIYFYKDKSIVKRTGLMKSNKRIYTPKDYCLVDNYRWFKDNIFQDLKEMI